jgi:hypothetical protein
LDLELIKVYSGIALIAIVVLASIPWARVRDWIRGKLSLVPRPGVKPLPSKSKYIEARNNIDDRELEIMLAAHTLWSRCPDEHRDELKLLLPKLLGVKKK